MSAHLAIDLGAESGRVMLGTVTDDRLQIEEIHRFPNGPITHHNSLRWDIDTIFNEILHGIALAFSHRQDIETVGITTWGVDYVLLDADGNRLGLPYHYRDSRTDTIVEEVCRIIPKEELYRQTGIQTLSLNTLFQLVAHQREQPEDFKRIYRLLYMPDYIHYLLTGSVFNEYTIASTSQLMDMRTGQYNADLLKQLQIPIDIFPPIIQPCHSLGRLAPQIQKSCGGMDLEVIAVASHDTASAVVGTPAVIEEPWAYLSSGTWSLLGVERSEVLINDTTTALQLTNEGGFASTIRLLKNLMGLWLLQELRRDWSAQGYLYSYTDLTNMAATAQPFAAYLDIQDPVFLPPGNMEARIKQYLAKTGQRYDFDHGQLVRIILEGLAFRYSDMLQKIEVITGEKIKVLHIVGGGSQNALLNQLTADAAGVRVCAGPAEATICGNIMVQVMAKRHSTDLKSMRRMIANSFDLRTFEPTKTSQWQQAKNMFLRICRD